MKKVAFINKQENKQVKQLVRGLKKFGYAGETINQESVEFSDYEFLVLKGMRGMNKHIVKHANSQGVPVLILDAGYLNRREDYWQVGLNKLNWIQTKSFPSDRFDKLGHALCNNRKEDGYVMVCGQIPGDAQHMLGTVDAYETYYTDLFQKISKLTKRQIAYRPHPGRNRGLGDRPNSVHTVLPVSEDLFEQMDKAWCTVSYNSGSGNESLLRGVPTFCTLNAMYLPSYEKLAYKHLEFIEACKPPTYEERLEHFSKLAYSQWTCEEFSSTQFWEIYLELLSDWKEKFNLKTKENI